MPSRDPIQRFEDILENIARIEQHTASVKSEADFVTNLLLIDAVERCLERISEPAAKLGTLAEEACPGVPWGDIRGLGNVLRHEYDRVERVRVWYMVEDDLPPLKAAVEDALTRLRRR